MQPTPPFRIGHVLIKVDHLKTAVNNFTKLGFRVTYPTKPDKSVNAMIYFKDGSFLELFCTNFGQPLNSLIRLAVRCMLFFKKPDGGRYDNYTRAGEGFRDYALDSFPNESFQRNMEAQSLSGLHVHGPKRMKRKNENGTATTWSIYYPGDEKLPFFMSPYKPAISLSEALTTHPNGSYGFQELMIVTDEWSNTLDWYRILLQQNPPVESGGNGMSCRFRLGDTVITLKNGNYNGIEKVILKNKLLHQVKTLDRKFCHGAELELN
ncbi:VOC family protein [Paenibacillus sp. CAU 1782]